MAMQKNMEELPEHRVLVENTTRMVVWGHINYVLWITILKEFGCSEPWITVLRNLIVNMLT